MNVIYPAVFHKENNSYWVDFPDLAGCRSFGDTIAEALSGAEEALSAYCASLLKTGKQLPQASDISTLTAPEGAFLSLVDARVTDGQSAVKKTLTIPAWLNTIAEEAHAPYSRILQEGLERYLGLSDSAP